MTEWKRLTGETTKAYEAFTEYIKLETGERSLEKVSEKLQKSVTLLGRWSRSNNWVERATAYDDYLREQDRREFEAQRKKAKSDRIKILSGFKAIVAQSLKNLNVDDPRYGDVTAALRLLLEQERIEFDDLPTTKTQNLNIDLSQLTTEQLERIAKGEDVYSVIANPNPGSR